MLYVADVASVAIFNTLDVTRRLRGAGFTEQQAEGIADTLAKDALTEFATKADLVPLATKQALKDLEMTLTLRMAAITAAGLAALGAFLKH